MVLLVFSRRSRCCSLRSAFTARSLTRWSTDRRDWCAHGARRANNGRSAAGRESGNDSVLFGLVIGVGAALALGRLIASQLYQTSAHNPLLLIATIAVLGGAALLACSFLRVKRVSSTQWKHCEQSNPRLGSARVSRVGESVPLSRTFRGRSFRRDAETNTRETRALPRASRVVLLNFSRDPNRMDG